MWCLFGMIWLLDTAELPELMEKLLGVPFDQILGEWKVMYLFCQY